MSRRTHILLKTSLGNECRKGWAFGVAPRRAPPGARRWPSRYLSLAGQICAPPSAICPVRGRYAAGIFCGGESARQARAYARRRPEAGDEHIDRAAGPCPTHGRTGRPTKASFQRAPLVAQIPDDEGDQTYEALENEALVERFRDDFSEKA